MDESLADSFSSFHKDTPSYSLNNEKDDDEYSYTNKSPDGSKIENMNVDDDNEEDFETESKRQKTGSKKKRGRKPKIIADSDSDKEVEVYCLCRSSKTDQFMICCDRCEEWFHGPCVNITQSFSRKIINYFCPLCKEKDPTLEIQFKEPNQPTFLDNDEDSDDSFDQTGHCIYELPIFKNPDLISDSESEEDQNEFFTDEEDDEDDVEFKINNIEKKRGRKRKNRKPGPKGRQKKSTEKTKGQKRGRKKGQSAKTKETKTRGRGRKKNVDKKSHEHSHRRNRHKTQSDESQDELKANVPRQCYGPECVNAARKGSKYCSDECGTKLARNRIMEILPHRITEWQSIPCAADNLSMRELEEIRREQNNATAVLAELDRKQIELESIISRAKNQMPYTEEESAEIIDNEQDSDYIIHCITCSQDISIKIALKHMERCFNKIESQTSFGSAFKTKIEGQTVFCDAYNSNQHTYCKRLRVLCPEHSKEPKISDDEVCGCPLPSEQDPFIDSGDLFCRILRKKCNSHYGWEKYRQAVLDAQRIQQWLKLDELLEREQKARKSMSSRHGVVPLLLHRTST